MISGAGYELEPHDLMNASETQLRRLASLTFHALHRHSVQNILDVHYDESAAELHSLGIPDVIQRYVGAPLLLSAKHGISRAQEDMFFVTAGCTAIIMNDTNTEYYPIGVTLGYGYEPAEDLETSATSGIGLIYGTLIQGIGSVRRDACVMPYGEKDITADLLIDQILRVLEPAITNQEPTSGLVWALNGAPVR